METDKPLAGALSIARELLESKGAEIPSFPHIYDECTCADCGFYRTDVENAAREIARYSGLAELVEAVDEMERADFTNLRERSTASLVALLDAQRKVIAAARRVREG